MAARAGLDAVLLSLVGVALATRALAGPLLASHVRERLDALAVVGLAAFVLLLAERLRRVLNL